MTIRYLLVTLIGVAFAAWLAMTVAAGVNAAFARINAQFEAIEQ